MLQASPAAQNLVASCNGAKVSTQALQKAQIATTATTKMLTIASKALGVVLNVGLSLGITAIVKGIQYLCEANERYIESQQKIIDKSEENIQKYDDEIDSLNELQEKLNEAKGNKAELAKIQKELNDAIGNTPGLLNSETNAYDIANQKIDDRIKRLEKLRKLELDKKITAQKEIFDNSLVDNAWGIDHKFDYFSKHKLIANDLSNAQFKDYIDEDLNNRFATLQELFENLKKNNYGEGKKSNAEIWKELIDSYGGAMLETSEIQDFFDNQALFAKELLKDYIENSESVFSKEELNSIVENLIESGYSQDLEGIKNIITSLVKNDNLEGLINEYYESLFNDDIDSDKLYQNIKIQFDELSNKYPEIKGILDNFFNSIGKNIEDALSQETQPTSLLSLEDAKKAVNGFKDGDTEIIGLIEEYELLQEVLSDTGNIQEETYEKLLSCSAKYSTAIRTENGRITVNTSKLKAVAKSRQLDTKEAIRQTLALKKQEWVQWNNGIENYNGTLLDSITINYENIDALQSQITQYELLANSVDNTSSAFENFKNAQSTEDQDMYNTAQDAFNVLKGYSSDPENENFGKYNRDEFQEAAMLLMDNDTYKKALNAKDLDEYQKIVDSFVKSVEPLFDEKNYNSAANLFDRINEIMDSGDVPEADIDWAKRLGISKEMFHALSQFGNQYDFNHKEIFESYQLNTLDEYQSLLSNVKTAQEALNECTEKTGNKYDYLSMELDEAKRKYSEFKNETADTLENAYADYIHSGAKSKGDFAEYLKKSMDFDDSDITGSIDVLLDKSKSLQENLANMPPDSEAYELYKKQLEEINILLDSLGFDENAINDTGSLDDKISQYKELAKQAEEYRKTLETEDSGSDSYKEAAQELERITGLMSNLRDPLRLEINSNIAEIDSQISQLDEKLNGLKESLQHASTSTEAHTIHMDIKGAENEKSKLEGQKEELQKTLKIIVDSTEVDEYDPEEKEGTVKYSPDFTNVINAETPKLKGTIEYEAKLPNQPTAPTSPTTKANGTFNAFAQGTGSDVSIPKDEKALVNELGEEGVVCFYATLYSDVYEKFYLIAGNPLEPYKLQRNDETGISAKV